MIDDYKVLLFLFYIKFTKQIVHKGGHKCTILIYYYTIGKQYFVIMCSMSTSPTYSTFD